MFIRPAFPEDAPNLAKLIEIGEGELFYTLAHCQEESCALAQFENYILRDSGPYSWRNILVAVEARRILGMVISFAGGQPEEVDMPLVAFLSNPEHKLIEITQESREGELYLNTLAVYPEQQGKGIGGDLVEAVAHKARELGFQRISLLVLPDNNVAQRLYSRHGFTLTEYVNLCGIDYLRMSAEVQAESTEQANFAEQRGLNSSVQTNQIA